MSGADTYRQKETEFLTAQVVLSVRGQNLLQSLPVLHISLKNGPAAKP